MSFAATPGRASLPERIACCPNCGEPLDWRPEVIRCASCLAEYPVLDGIPVLLRDVAVNGGQIELPDHHKAGQARFFDAENHEYEVTRPRGQPAIHGWLLESKFRLGSNGVPNPCGGTALSVCGGSGLDAEFLARAGFEVVSCDISLGATRRARERARRSDLTMTAIVADVEHLPFGDAAFDLVYVHDGLHHLEDPLVGLSEMARVSAGAVSVNEPARAAATAVAMALGIAEDEEEPGNAVQRMTLPAIAGHLEAHGFCVTASRRYAMFYRHRPGWPSRLLSRRATLPAAQRSFAAFNRVAGPRGNKLTVQAVRVRETEPAAAPPDRQAARGVRLPMRYQAPWVELFEARLQRSLVEGARVLDIGSGRRPAVPPARRPPGCEYVGLDLSAAELAAAAPDAYDETIEADVSELLPSLCERFDLIVGWQVLEHVDHLDRCLENLRCYLRPGGSLVSMLSGRNSCFAVLNRVLPDQLGSRAMDQLLDRPPDTVFHAHYHGCTDDGLRARLAPWSRSEVLPLYRGAGYLRFSAAMQKAYLRYEDWAFSRGRANLATHYLIVAER